MKFYVKVANENFSIVKEWVSSELGNYSPSYAELTKLDIKKGPKNSQIIFTIIPKKFDNNEQSLMAYNTIDREMTNRLITFSHLFRENVIDFYWEFRNSKVSEVKDNKTKFVKPKFILHKKGKNAKVN